MAENEARTLEPRTPPSGGLTARDECAKEAHPRDVSYIEHQPDKLVVLSPRLEQLCREVDGCQIEQVLALVRRIMFEVISQRKY